MAETEKSCFGESLLYNAVGREAIEGLRFLASLPLAGTGREKTQPFNRFHSRLFIRMLPSCFALSSQIPGSHVGFMATSPSAAAASTAALPPPQSAGLSSLGETKLFDVACSLSRSHSARYSYGRNCPVSKHRADWRVPCSKAGE